jgi:hypothetical protein
MVNAAEIDERAMKILKQHPRITLAHARKLAREAIEDKVGKRFGDR